MSVKAKRGVLVVGHGSRRREANDDVREAARRIAERGRYPLVEAAFLEIEDPDVSEAFARLVERGANEIIVHPYFLSPGRHTRGDIPVEVHKAAVRHPGINYRITEPLSAHPLVIAASVERLRETIDREDAVASGTAGYRARPGQVYLVGAGPGDPGLLTIKARELLAACDVVIYDYLVNPEILGHVPLQAERIYVGKVGGGRQTPQDHINSLLIDHAQKGARVVRLKGGDPFLFGRGGEEAEALRAVGIPFEVVPGISSALAVPAYAGIPLTHRDFSSSVSVVTGARARDGATRLSGELSADTLVILMGVTQLREIVADLIAAGRPPETPAAVVRWGTYEGQLTVTGTLATIATEARKAGMRPPAVIVVGEVVKLRARLGWFEQTLETIEEIQAVFAAV
jgi:uroporphyrin-III C-methyltransferase